ncbi:hypothetical protein QQ008_20765 [Fulvivirgaceae bacterium BMA10]|uniref:DUF1801 domain-containing protein n=1 Tax=Splendidivirga corallicola TaxID=3051826 RepID=A0ABT8KSW4_9BACT|nr:hypothetical protein [Fulvivirgaceae bacterium BMA10]
MSKAKARFEQIGERMISQFENVQWGKMMSSPAIVYNKKVFAFYYDDGMTFRLGADFDLEGNGIHDYQLLNPFKNKGPLKGWFVIHDTQMDQWESLAKSAYELIKK